MKLSFEVIKDFSLAFLGIFIGFQLFSDHKPKDPPPSPIQAQENTCVATITKKKNPDGSVDEVTQFLAKNSQSQSMPAVKIPVKLNSVGLFRDEINYKRKVYQDLNLLGFKFDLGFMVKANKDRADGGVNIDF